MRLTVTEDRSRGCWLRRGRLGRVVVGWAPWLGVLALFAAPTVARAAGNVYVTNGSFGTISQYAIGAGGGLSPLSPASISGVPGTGIAVSPDGKSTYVASTGNDVIDQFNIDPRTGALSPKTPPFVGAGGEPFAIVVTPDGKSAYATNIGNFGNITASVSQYSIDTVTGALSPKSPSFVATGEDPTGVAVAPDGKSAYVATDFVNVNTISQYSIDPLTGALSPKTPPTAATGASPGGVAVTPDGKSAYITNSSDDTVSQVNVDPVTGALSPKTPATVGAGVEPFAIVVTPDGMSAYVTNLRGNSVSQYTIDPLTGALSPKTPATVRTGVLPTDVAVTADGRSAYVTNFTDNTVSQYNVDPLTGALSPNTPATIATGAGPQGIAVTPLPRVHATSSSVRCSPSRFAPGDATVCTATVTDSASSGQSTPTGTLSFTSSGAGRLFGSPCILSGSGASASCAVFFTSLPRGEQGITARYVGDATHSGSAGSTIVVVAVPTSTNGCAVFGHGRITATNGDRASFRGLVAATPPRGVEFYRDHGPASAMRVRSTSVDALTCNVDATQASVFGTVTVNGSGSVEYRIDIQLTAWEWGKDTYRIRLSSGYDSGAEQIRHGDLAIHLRNSEHHHLDPNANHYRTGASQDGG